MRPRISQPGLLHCVMAFVLMLLGAPVEASMPRLLPPGPPPPPASMGTHWVRYDHSDTITARVRVGFDKPSAGWRGEWRLQLPDGLQLVDGQVGGSGLTHEIEGLHVARIHCTHWGTFIVHGWFRTGLDSLNWTSHEYQAEVRVTRDSFSYHVVAPALDQKHVVGGVHHRSTGWVWLPLDPGESETVEPGFDERNQKSPPPALHKASGVLPGAVSKDSSVTVMVRVAVDREGRVKDVYARRVAGFHPPEMIDAAVEAARRWTFPPAKSYGRPASALYSIGVPVLIDRKAK